MTEESLNAEDMCAVTEQPDRAIVSESVRMHTRDSSVPAYPGKDLTQRITTMRQAVLAHGGEALEQREAFRQLSAPDQDALIEFLKTLQVLPPGTKDLVVDEHYLKKR